MGSFHWKCGDVVLQTQMKVAVCHADWGGIEIRQEAFEPGDEDEVIELSPMGALQIAWRLIQVANFVGLPTPPRDLMVASDMGPSAPMPCPAVLEAA